MELKFLGTSGATPTMDRNLPAIAMRLDSGEIILFDAGEDVQRRFEAAKLKFNVPTTILISHLHGDHVIGLPGLLFNFHLNGRTAPLTIIGPQGLAAYLLFHFQLIGLKAQSYSLSLIEVQFPKDDTPKGGMDTIQYRNFLTSAYERAFVQISGKIIKIADAYVIKTYWMKHSMPTLGYRYEEKPHDGKFNPERAKELNIRPGILWKRMQKGETIKINGDTEINPILEGIVTEKRPGYIVAYSGDTMMCPNLVTLAKNADYFICESTYIIEDEKLAIEKLHMSTKMAATVARDANVGHLFLVHFSGRYRDVMILEEEARRFFQDTTAAVDLMNIEIKPKK
ncbi:Ribonuclease Z [Candidatus Lokiarchaeum ossiferum]|uniref:Ribonuclease Z n=1 Tax=Candidatus Lokiarchaeum ossiferum TaxID=2951803 RepID=A0ABY6HND0_9ARCH|nr:Ribonuclease Z [Candidatus Lokiarchaeum sp. B-35]